MGVIERGNIDSHIEHIASQLKNKKASAMVGAGYSFNAVKIDDSVGDYSDWKQLGILFYEKLHGTGTRPNSDDLDPIALASEVCREYGRNAVDQIILQAVPDHGYKPGILHTMLLELPWNDVFTTNYDTLLEDASRDLKNPHYMVVADVNSIPLSGGKSRIIKLHGSYPSNKPWIITKEDYEEYPGRFGVFYNQVISAMSKDVFCLFGFSGDDPNFIQWCNWIQKELGEYAPSIYIIGFFTEADLMKYKKRTLNLKIINMGLCEGVHNHADGLKLFFEKLNQYLMKHPVQEIESKGMISKERDIILNPVSADSGNTDWVLQRPKESAEKMDPIQWKLMRTYIESFLKNKEDREKERQKAIQIWRKERESYPGWFIAPKGSRDILYYYTHNAGYLLSDVKEMITIDMLEFAFELGWRYETGLFSMDSFMQQKLAAIIDWYQPVIQESKEKGKELWLHDNAGVTLPKGVEDWWLYLCFLLLREYREDGKDAEWKKLWKRVNQLKEALSQEDCIRLEYEGIMRCYTKLELVELQQQLHDWSIPKEFYDYRLKRLGLLLELGETFYVQKELKSLCNELEYAIEQENCKDIIFKKSILACALMMYSLVLQGINFIQGKYGEKPKELDDTLKQIAELSSVYDMQGDLKKLSAEISNHILEKKGKKQLFDLDRETISLVSFNDAYCREAYQYIRILEKVHCPFQVCRIALDRKTVNRAISCLSRSHAFLSIFSILRSDDYKNVEEICDREYLIQFKQAEIDNLVIYITKAVRRNLSVIESQNRWRGGSLYTSIAVTSPEMLSRLCVRCSTSALREILLLIKDVYSLETVKNFINLKNLIVRFMKCMSDKTKAEFLPILLELGIPEGHTEYDRLELVEPFDLFTFHTSAAPLFQAIRLDDYQIDKLFEDAAESARKREAIISRLITLHELNLLDEKHQERFGRLLWENVDDVTGLPNLPNYYCSIYLTLPHPLSIQPVQRIKEYLLSCEMDHSHSQGFTITMGDIRFLREIILCAKTKEDKKGFLWEVDEAEYLLNKMVDWWDQGKDNLYKEESPGFFLVADEYRRRYQTMVDACTAICRSVNGELPFSVIERLLAMAQELAEAGIRHLALETSIYQDRDMMKLIDKIEEALYSLDREKVIDASNAVQYLADEKYYINGVEILLEVLSLLLRLRKQPSLSTFINVLHNILYTNSRTQSDKFYHNIICGLDYIYHETEYDKDTVIRTLKEKIEIRRNAANLASMLYVHLRNNGLDVPESLQRRKSVCQNPEEFAEVRNAGRF